MTDNRFEDINRVAKGYREQLLQNEMARVRLENEEPKKPGQMVKTREDEVMNNAGGYVFPVSDLTRIRRFLILGCTGGTYYSSEQKMKLDNAQALCEIIENGKGDIILKEIRDISLAGRNPKQETLLFALALCARYKVKDFLNAKKKETDADVKYMEYILSLHRTAMSIVTEVCRIPTHLFMFVKFCQEISEATGKGKDEGKGTTGWGRLMRGTIQEWYDSKSPEQLAMHLTKYRNREGWTHRDLFRLSHPRHKDNCHYNNHQLEVEQLYRFAVKGDLTTRKRKLEKEKWEIEQPDTKYTAIALDNELNSKALDLVETFLKLDKETPEEEVIKAIKEHRLVREHIPTDHLNSVGVWQALLDHMPMTAMIRNLGKLSSIKALNEHYTQLIVDQLTNEENLKKAKIHPITVLLAKTVYQNGRGDKGKLTWEVDPKINQALEDAFYKSFINAPPTGKRFCFAYDVSGSMCCQISGTKLSCRTASAALSLVSLRNEKEYECVAFCDKLVEVPFDGTWNIQKIEDYMDGMNFGATDCALPMLWAKKNGKQVDVFVVFTDCETWSGDIKPFEALRQYREASGILDAKLIVMGMTSTGFTLADPSDAGMLDIVGFDSAVPTLINEFVTGQL